MPKSEKETKNKKNSTKTKTKTTEKKTKKIDTEIKEKEVKSLEPKVESNKEEKESKKKYLIFLLLLLFITIFGISVTFGKNIYDAISEQIIEVLNLNKPTAPVITGGSEDWAKERLIKVEKDSEAENGLAYYEYCVTKSKSTKNCEWKKTTTKNKKVVETGIYYVTFRAVDKEEKRGYNSNTEVVYIDNNNPVIKNIKTKNITTNSISLEVNATDEHSGIKSYLYSLDGKNYVEGKLNYTYSNLEKNKEYTIYIKVEDNVGNNVILSMQVKTKDESQVTTPEETPEPTPTPSDKPEEKPEPTPTPSDKPEATPEPIPTPSDKPEETPEPTPTPSDKPEETPEPTPTPSEPPVEDDEEEDLEIPEINLDKVPVEFVYGSKYDLPSYYKFGPSGGEIECTVEGNKYTDTSTLKVGMHNIECIAKGNNGINIRVSKQVKVTVEEGIEEVWDGWIRLNLYYPDNSTDWQWRLGSDGEAREETWQDYTGPILVKLEDVENVYIRYKINKEVVIIPPTGIALVSIEPEAMKINKDETTTVEIIYDENAKTKLYKIDNGEWQEYTGKFRVTANTLVQAKVTVEEEIKDSTGNVVSTQINTATDAVLINEIISENDEDNPSNPGEPTEPEDSITEEINSEKVDFGNMYVEIIPTAYSLLNDDTTTVNIYYEENATEKLYKVGNGDWQEYTGSFEVGKNTAIYASTSGVRSVTLEDGTTKEGIATGKDNIYIYDNEDYTDYTIQTYTTRNPIDNSKTTKVYISTSHQMKKLEYSLNGNNYQEAEINLSSGIKELVEVRANTLVMVKATFQGKDGLEKVKYDSVYIGENTDSLRLNIQSGVRALGSNNETAIRLTTNVPVEVLEYKVNDGEYQTYNGVFNVTKDTLITARAIKTNDDGTIQARIQTLYIDEIPLNININTSENTVLEGKTVTVELVSNINNSTIRYSLDGINYQTYNGKFQVPGDTTIYAIAETPNTDGTIEKAEAVKKIGLIKVETLAGPQITITPNEELVEEVTVTLTTEETAREIYYKIGTGIYQKYEREFIVNKNTSITAYYIREVDGLKSKNKTKWIQNIKNTNKPYVKIDVNPDPINENLDETKVTITGSNYDSLQYSFDGEIYYDYTKPLTITESTTIYARGINEYGETIEKRVITLNISPSQEQKLDISIFTTPENPEGLVNKATVTINYDSQATNKYYKLAGDKDYKEYTGPFEITENTTVYAYATGDNASGKTTKGISFLTTGIMAPIITITPQEASNMVTVSIEFDKNATTSYYQINNGTKLYYNGPFEIYENSDIYAYNSNSLDYENDSTLTVNNIITLPKYVVLDKGKYYIIKLNYPSTTSEEGREYKWKPDGEWKVYDENGILLIKPGYEDEIVNGSSDGIKVEDSNGNEVVFTDHYYLIDVEFSKLMENLFMRWDTVKPEAPVILPSTTDPAKEVDITINYSSSLVEKYYKVVLEDGTDSGWQEYKDKFKIDSNNVVIYAKGKTYSEIESEVASTKITNIDLIAPEMKVKGDFTTLKQQATVSVTATDNLMMSMVMWASGNQTAEYFQDNGTSIRNPGKFTVTENGKYTIYAVDQVGNATLQVIEVTNIDLNAPDIIINVLTERYGTTAEVSIDYGDSTTKEYRIGEKSKTYKSYTDNIIIKANDILDLVNEDGSLTIYAKGTDEAGNIEEVSERIYVLDLDAPLEPVIYAGSGYPILTEYGVKLGAETYIVYDQTRDDITNYYSLDNGETWEIYTGPFETDSGTILAKSVKQVSGLTVTTTKKVDTPTDAIGGDAYDGKTNSSFLANKGTYKILVDSSMWGNSIYLTGSVKAASNYAVSIQLYTNNKTTTVYTGKSETNLKRHKIDIPEGTTEIRFSTQNSTSWSISIMELEVDTTPVINVTKIYPKLTEYGPEQGYSEVTIDYFQTAVKRLYSIDGGNTWLDYQDKIITLPLDTTIQVKSINKYGNESFETSYKSVLPDDAVGIEAYDRNPNNSFLANKGTYKLLIDPSMWRNSIYFNGVIDATTSYPVYIQLLVNGKIQEVYKGTKETNLKNYQIDIPEGTTEIRFSTQSSTSWSISIKELEENATPTLEIIKYYPEITENGINVGYDLITPKYFKMAVKKLYSLDEGVTWLEYEEKPIKVPDGNIAKFKSINKYGTDSEIVTHKTQIPDDALENIAYDNSTSTEVDSIDQKIYIDETMYGQYAKIIFNASKYRKSTLTMVLKDGTKKEFIIHEGGDTGTATVTRSYLIPNDALYMTFNCVVTLKIKEISPNTAPVANAKKYYSTLTENGVKDGYNEVELKYFSTAVKRLYSLDDGATWIDYQDKAIRLTNNNVIKAKSIDKNGKESEILTYTSVLPDDAIGENAYDGKDTTSIYGPSEATSYYRYINVSPEVINSSVKLIYGMSSVSMSSARLSIEFMNDDKAISSQTLSSKETEAVIIIPENTTKIRMRFTSSQYGNTTFRPRLSEISIVPEPTISQTNIYPNLSLNLTTDSHIEAKINYLPKFTQKLYSLDSGNTWQEYTGPFKVNAKEVIQAKAITESGTETKVVTYTVSTISDSLDYKAFDNNIDTAATVSANKNKIFMVSEDTIGKDIRFFFSGTIEPDATIVVYDSSNEELENISIIDELTVFEIPENSYKIVVNAGSSALSISEINIRQVEFNNMNNNPVIETGSVDWSYSKTIVITYPEGYKNEYSLDLGETWQEYLSPITVDKATTVLARTVENGKVISSSSYTITKIDTTEPEITLDIPEEIIVGTEYNLPTNYSVDETKSGGKAICMIGEEEVTNTKSLAIGAYEITCTVTTGAGKEKSITKTINVVDETIDITLEIPDRILVGSNYNLPTSVTGNESVCKIGETEYTNTNTLEVGTYEIICSVTSIGGNTKEVTKKIEVYEETVNTEEESSEEGSLNE